MVLNLKTAKALGITVSQSILERADTLMEQPMYLLPTATRLRSHPAGSGLLSQMFRTVSALGRRTVQILISSRVARAVEAVASLEDLGNLELKGLELPVAAFNVTELISETRQGTGRDHS